MNQKQKLLGRPKSYSPDQLREAVSKSSCFAEVIRRLGKAHSGANYLALKRAIREYGVDTSHFLPTSELLRKNASGNKIPDSDVFKENSSISPKTLVVRFRALNIVAYKCEQCSCPPVYNNKPLVLQLDHINGICNDNRVENLRWLCPNCHTQTETYAKRNSGNVPRHISERRRRNIDRRLNSYLLPEEDVIRESGVHETM